MYWERLFDVMGNGKYHDFALWFYKERSRNEVKWDVKRDAPICTGRHKML